jgi:hypothetical protein
VAVGDAEEPAAATDLQVDKLGPDTALADTIITYTLLVTNNLAFSLADVIITDTWNSQLYSGTYETGGDVSVVSAVFVTQPFQRMQFNLAPLPANSNGYVQITMAITAGLQPRYTAQPTVFANSAVITTSTPGVTANTDNVHMIIGPSGSYNRHADCQCAARMPGDLHLTGQIIIALTPLKPPMVITETAQ